MFTWFWDSMTNHRESRKLEIRNMNEYLVQSYKAFNEDRLKELVHQWVALKNSKQALHNKPDLKSLNVVLS